MCSKYRKGLHWIIGGDTNDLKLDSILQLNSSLKQVVNKPTRLNPSRILDPIITTLFIYYQIPECLPPLDPDPDCNGKPSDHKMVVMKPITVLNNRSARVKRKITFRPFTEKGFQQMESWLEKETWNDLYSEKLANRKAEKLQSLLIEKYSDFFPEKVRVVSSDDQPYYSQKLLKLKRKKGREFHKRRTSTKWKTLNDEYEVELSNTKKKYYGDKIKQLRKAKPSKWYSELKKLTSYNQHESEEIVVEDIKDLSNKEQAEMIANKFAEVSIEYDKLKDDDVEIPEYADSDIPQFTEYDVQVALEEMDASKSNVPGDVPAKILKQFSKHLARPVQNVINTSIVEGKWPDIFKLEVVTPVPKEFPPKSIEQLRNISGLLNLDKIAEKLISKLMISDMKAKLDSAQFANQKGLSINHYLIKMIDRVLETLDKNSRGETCAVLATWS